jgi:hypothetical protein
LIIVIASVLAAAGLAAAGHAAVYKWVDENGDVHYSDQRPNQAADTVDIEAAPPVNSPQAVERNKQVDDALKIVTETREEREESDRERDEVIADRQAHQLKCQQVRTYRDRLEQGGFLYRKNDEHRNALSDEEIAAEVSKLNQQLKENCTAL